MISTFACWVLDLSLATPYPHHVLEFTEEKRLVILEREIIRFHEPPDEVGLKFVSDHFSIGQTACTPVPETVFLVTAERVRAPDGVRERDRSVISHKNNVTWKHVLMPRSRNVVSLACRFAFAL
jgi:hypothetical protein